MLMTISQSHWNCFSVRTVLMALSIAIVNMAVHSQPAPSDHRELADKLLETGLRNCEAYDRLKELCAKAPHRLSGSAGAATAVELTQKMMLDNGFSNVHREKIMVPRWVRGEEECFITPSRSLKLKQTAQIERLNICALGGSVATPSDGIEGEVIEVKSLKEVAALQQNAKGKIIFYNRPFDGGKLNTFEAYGGAVDQRSRGAIEAAKVGAVGVLVRSMTLALDDVPHTGMMNYADTVKKIPAAAVSTLGANRLSGLLAKGNKVRVRMRLTCQTLPDVESANVVGELTGSEKPKEVIVLGGHLDAWDKGQGAHDDGAGCMQAIEAIHLLKSLGVKPRRTIRAVMFMNEENGTRGGKAYPVAPERKGETAIAAFESDAGGHAPRGFSVKGDSLLLAKVLKWKPLFEKFNAGQIQSGYAGVDIDPLVGTGVPGFGMIPENHRYFDYHHSDNDTIDKVNPRELELGAIVMAMWAYLVSEEGL